MKRHILLLGLLLSLATLLSGCSGKTPPGEATLKEDLRSSDAFSGYTGLLGLEITDFEIVKRQTTEEDKIDTVWVSVNSSSPNVESCMYFTMVYKLYNDGWLFEYATEDNTDLWSFTPLAGVSDEDIRSYLPADAEVLSNDLDLNAGTQTVTYIYTKPHTYCDFNYKCTITFEFDKTYWGAGEWRALGDENNHDYGHVLESTYIWHDLSGSWYGERVVTTDVWKHTLTTREVNMEIKDFSAHDGVLSVEVDVNLGYRHGVPKRWSAQNFSGTYSSDGDHGYCEVNLGTTYDGRPLYLIFAKDEVYLRDQISVLKNETYLTKTK